MTKIQTVVSGRRGQYGTVQLFHLVHVFLYVLHVAAYVLDLIEELLHEHTRVHVDANLVVVILVLRLDLQGLVPSKQTQTFTNIIHIL